MNVKKYLKGSFDINKHHVGFCKFRNKIALSLTNCVVKPHLKSRKKINRVGKFAFILFLDAKNNKNMTYLSISFYEYF